MKNWLRQEILESIKVKQDLIEHAEILDLLDQMCRIAEQQYRNGSKLIVAGNGGSAADAQHIAGELVSRFYFNRPALPAIALTTDTSILTAIGNDYGYEDVFARQVEALGVAGDIFLGISTSGNSPNIVHAAKAAKKKGLKVFAFTGLSGGTLASLCDICIKVPSSSTPRIQETHIVLGHLLCAHIERALFKNPADQ
jgi:D-sedoheptulose 7-phosphate isomerase